MRGSYVPLIVTLCVVAVIAALIGDWLLGVVFLAMAAAFGRLQIVVRRRR
jgi:hypothetical protein